MNSDMPDDVTPPDGRLQASGPTGPEEPLLRPIDWKAARAGTERVRKRRRVIGGAVSVTLIVAASIGAWLRTGDDEKQPTKHTATMPTAFGHYRLADKDKSLWSKSHGGDNLDPTTETAHATYVRADGKKSFMITLELDPAVDVSDPGEDDDVISTLLNTPVDSGEVKSYDPGPIGGKLRCVGYKVSNTTSSRCVWGNDAATVTAQPVVTSGPRPTPRRTATEVRSFLAELRIRTAS